MKNKGTYILVIVTAVFIAMTIGFLIGRSIGGGQVTINQNTPTQAGALWPTHADAQKLNINTASADALCELPGIGPITAQRIIDYRNENGFFTDILQLKNVEGIGEKIFSEIRDLITVGG